jgi:hypothetical protein
MLDCVCRALQTNLRFSSLELLEGSLFARKPSLRTAGLVYFFRPPLYF